MVDELVDAGLVTRTPNPDDRRSAFAELSPAGRSAFRRAAPIYLELIGEHLGARLAAGVVTVVLSASLRQQLPPPARSRPRS